MLVADVFKKTKPQKNVFFETNPISNVNLNIKVTRKQSFGTGAGCNQLDECLKSQG